MKINVDYVEGIPGELDKYFKKDKRHFFILDGFMDEASKSLKITQSFTHGRDDNLYEIYLMQKFFHKNQHVLSLNFNYI